MPNMSIYVSIETFLELTELAQKNKISPSMQARRLIEEALKEAKKKTEKAAEATTHTPEVKGSKRIEKRKDDHA